MKQRIRTAVLPAGGTGTRMLPATNAVPKELLPVGRKPAIQWVIEEAYEAGIERFIVVSSLDKPAIAAYLLGHHQSRKIFNRQKHGGQSEFFTKKIQVINQPVARGLGDAVRIAHSILGAEPFALLLPDEILLGGPRLLTAMLDDFAATGQSGVSLLEVERAEIALYGCAAVSNTRYGSERLVVTACVEKPEPVSAPSCFAISGRYVLGSDVLDLLITAEADEQGEVQITPVLDIAARQGNLAGFVVRDEDGRVDVGNWAGWQEANVRLFAGDQSQLLGTGTDGWNHSSSGDGDVEYALFGIR